MTMLVDLGNPNVPGSGVFGRDGFAAMNLNTRRAAFRMGLLGKLAIFSLGDSMMGNGGTEGYASFLSVARLIGGDPDIYFANGSYYNNDNGQPWPDGPRGMNFAAGGKDTIHMRDVQMLYIRQAYLAGTLPTDFFMSAMQNDQFWAGQSTEETFQRMKAVLDELVLVMGRSGVVLGPWPHSRLAASAWSKQFLDHRMKEYCATLPGVEYISILDALKSGDPLEEADGFANYIGWKLIASQVGRASWDEIHAAPLAARIVALLIIPALMRMARPYQMPVFEASAYDKLRNPGGNVYGGQGLLLGTGGYIVNVANPDPAQWVRTQSDHIPAGVELVYDHSKGIAITPQLTGGVKNRELKLTATGPATADVQGALRFAVNADVPNQDMEVVGLGRWQNQNGWAGIALGNAGQGAPGIPNDQIITSFRGHGSFGGADYVMPYELNDKLTFRSMPFGYNAGNRKILMDVGFGFAKDVPVSGSLIINRVGMFKTTPPATN